MAQPIFIDNEKFKDICETIGYTFNNPYLLEQAFIRKSYSIEHPGVENNEVLEFLGDKVLDYVIVWSMSTPEWYGSFTQSHQFHSKFDEGKLTNIKKNLVDKEMLAKRMAILDLSKYLVMGNGDIQNNAQNDPSVLEDLFEAILGAAAIDCRWNSTILRNLVYKMLDPVSYLNQGYDQDFNYCSQLQDWCLKHKVPLEFKFCELSPEEMLMTGGIAGFSELLSGYKYSCYVNMFNKTFKAQGQSKAGARMKVSKIILDYIKMNKIGEEKTEEAKDKSEVSEDSAVQVLNIFYQKGVIKKPLYEFEEKHDQNGKPYWHVKLSIPEFEPYFYGDFVSQREGKRKLSLAMINKLIEEGIIK